MFFGVVHKSVLSSNPPVWDCLPLILIVHNRKLHVVQDIQSKPLPGDRHTATGTHDARKPNINRSAQ